ncbi:MAG: 5-(carboxyamino)imidazole ribonucleotide synthase [Alphaproteobacteria bacterium]|nr:5-(carboxyamino)imidazole ribonucleotide synthase [Alphaproteobacteria bacterium]
MGAEARVGILGGGQLGRMLAQAALPLGVDCVVYDDAHDSCAAAYAPVVQGSLADREALERFAVGLDVITFEFENVPAEAVQFLRDTGHLVHPGPLALTTAQDRWNEKRFFRDHGIRTTPFAKVDDEAGLQEAIAQLGLPAVLKARRLGYDGKGQLYLAHPEQAEVAWPALGGVPCILEKVVTFDREVSLLSVRGRSGEVRHYPLVENRHAGGVLRWSQAPALGLPDGMQQRAEAAAERVLEALDYVGVLAIEWFQVGDDLLANEMAPRVHNSGHFSIEGAATSQFENHIRAVLGWPLGETEVSPCMMVNLLGQIPDRGQILSVPGARLHDYAKAPRQGRKLGHVTITGPDMPTVAERARRVRALVEGTES